MAENTAQRWPAGWVVSPQAASHPTQLSSPKARLVDDSHSPWPCPPGRGDLEVSRRCCHACLLLVSDSLPYCGHWAGPLPWSRDQMRWRPLHVHTAATSVSQPQTSMRCCPWADHGLGGTDVLAALSKESNNPK